MWTLEAVNPHQSDQPCSQATKDVAQEPCCADTASAAPRSDFVSSGPRPYTGPVGSEPDCPICGNLEYPGLPYAFVIARYVGEFNCDQLYGRGLHGMIPDFMCGALQDFTRSVCGCGEFNPACANDPNTCYGEPGYNDLTILSGTWQPTQEPALQPIQRPTSESNVSPTIFNRKTPPEGSKYSTKLSSSRGGFGQAALRGGRRMEEGNELTEISETYPLK